MADNQNKQNKNGQEPNKNNNRQTVLMVAVCLLLSLMIFVLVSQLSEMNNNEISYNRFIEMVKADEIEKIELESNVLTVTPKKAKDSENLTETYTVKLVGDENGLNELLQDTGIEYIKKTPNVIEEIISTIVSIALPLVIMLVGFNFIMRGMGRGGIMGVGKSKARNYVQRETGVTFQDVAGEDEAKESLQEVVEFLHNPERYNQIGAILPKGALLVGPPGTGKTLLAKAVAGEAHVPFFSLSGSEFVEMFVGVGASRVRDLFEEAKKNAPCIIFIDEIDAIGKSRDSRFGGGNDEREQTLNQLLAEMDGFDSSKGLLILAATNRPEVLDPALLRPGRFDRRVIVDRPDLKGRIAILKVHAKDVLIDDTVDFEATALATSGAVGSDLANMINEAAILAVKNGRKAVSQEDLMAAVEVVLVGKEKKDRILSEEERRIVSYHEVGHALISALQKDAEPVQKITIIPRTMGALGYVLQVPEEEKYLNTKTELEAMVVGLLGGRAAEEIVFGNVTTGAANDIERATKLVRAMITQYGMSEKFGLMGLARVEHEYLSGRAVMDCGDATATEVDHEVMRILDESYQKAKVLLAANRHALDEIAAYLIKKETITGKEFMEILRQVQNEEKESGETEEIAGTEERSGTAESAGTSEPAGPVEPAGTDEPAGGTEPAGNRVSDGTEGAEHSPL